MAETDIIFLATKNFVVYKMLHQINGTFVETLFSLFGVAEYNTVLKFSQ